MALAFPSNPNTGDRFVVGRRSYIYDGSSWSVDILSTQGALGSPGSAPIGYVGSGGLGGPAPIKTDVYTVSGSPHTWTKEPGAQFIRIVAIGGGGGGAAGGGTGSAGLGGGGAGGGAIVQADLLAADVSDTETVTIGTGGAGATGFLANGSYGNATTFGNHVYAPGGVCGNAGLFSIPSNAGRYNVFLDGTYDLVSAASVGGAGSGTNGAGNTNYLQIPLGGGAGAGRPNSGARTGGIGGMPGGINGTANNVWNTICPSRASPMGTTATPTATNGNSGVTCGIIGTGGSGGGSSSSPGAGDAGNGGDGGLYGGGGGGGASDSISAVDSGGHGVGGRGGDGVCIVFQFA